MSGRAPPAPRTWMAEWPCPWPATRSLPDGAPVRACFVVVAVQLARTRNEQPYLRLTLSDCHGSVEGRLWDGAETAAGVLRAGSYVGVAGRISYFGGEPQLCVEAFELLGVRLEDLPLFLPRSPRAPAAMEAELEQLIASVREPSLHQLLHACLAADTEVGPGFRVAPAAKYHHHAYLGGLLEHTISVASICDRLAKHYGTVIDRDLLLTAALLHDIGKVREIGASAGFPYTDEGKLLGHILLGLQLVTDAARGVNSLAPHRLLLLQHLIAAHQGRFEWQSPREPATLEAIILHYADDLDAKLQQVRELIEHGEGPWTPYDRSSRREFLRYLQASEQQAADPAAAANEANTPADGGRSGAADPGASLGTPAMADDMGRTSSITTGASAEPTSVDDTDRSTPPSPTPPLTSLPAAGGTAAHRPGRGHGTSALHRLSEDTLDLFGTGP